MNDHAAARREHARKLPQHFARMLEMLRDIVERDQIERFCAKRKTVKRGAYPDANTAMLRDSVDDAIAGHRQLYLSHHREFHVRRGHLEYLMAASRVEPSRLRCEHRVYKSRICKLGVFP